MPSAPTIRASSLCRLLEHRHGGVLLMVGLSLAVDLGVRVALLVQAAGDVTWDGRLAGAFGLGLLFDLGSALLWALPVVVVLALLPRGAFGRRWLRGAAYAALAVFLGLKLFGGIAEWFFWDEFGSRFNFIAVDYLVYTREVAANIRESYPLPLVFAGLVGTAAVALFGLVRTGWVVRWLNASDTPGRSRWLGAAGWAAAALGALVALDQDRLPRLGNNFNRELAKDGLWSLFAAFRNNELEYEQFYATLPTDEAFARLRTELGADRAVPLTPDPRDTLRLVRAPGPELHPNVIQITVESLSAEFLGSFNPESKLTPNLDALAAKSLVFENLYATGTRTDRGMEALTLSLPPTPGRSLVKRPHNAGLFTLGSVFRSRGYDTAFLYGGYGYFDNMNGFFGGNGYRIVDRGAVAQGDITFANAWGACDEDTFRWTLREADADCAAGKPFHFFVMTTSNHRPFTFPEGKIDLPAKGGGRAGGVKYTDYAIGQLLAAAAKRPWFNNTIFVIVADHCASSAGRAELPVQKYHIPMLIYAPGGQIAPGRVKELTSQIDVAPTLLGLLGWTYASRFYGWDVRTAGGDRRALIGNYQRLGLFEPGMLTVLRPPRGVTEYGVDAATATLTRRPTDPAIRDETIAYYQTASYLYRNNGYRALTAEEHRRLEAAPPPPAAPAIAPTGLPPS